MSLDVKAIRNRCWFYLSPEIASVAGLTVPDLEQFIGGHFFPTDAQLAALARRMGLR